MVGTDWRRTLGRKFGPIFKRGGGSPSGAQLLKGGLLRSSMPHRWRGAGLGRGPQVPWFRRTGRNHDYVHCRGGRQRGRVVRGACRSRWGCPRSPWPHACRIPSHAQQIRGDRPAPRPRPPSSARASSAGRRCAASQADSGAAALERGMRTPFCRGLFLPRPHHPAWGSLRAHAWWWPTAWWTAWRFGLARNAEYVGGRWPHVELVSHPGPCCTCKPPTQTPPPSLPRSLAPSLQSPSEHDTWHTCQRSETL